MIFRQYFEALSSTYTYLVGCQETGQAMLIDPVYNTAERDLAMVSSLGLTLACTLETHVHADHITAALKLKNESGSRIIYPQMSQCTGADERAEAGKPVKVGNIALIPLHTPGHTDDSFCYLLGDKVFTGDALLIDGCGRTDFQNGDTATLYASIHEKLFTLPNDTLVYPAHDYQQRRVSTILQEKERNPRLGGGKTIENFTGIMDNLKLAYPKFIDHAVPGNQKCGVCPSDLPDNLTVYCGRMTESPQG